MDIEALEAKYSDLYAPTFEILIDGENLLKIGIEVISVSVDSTLEGADSFSFTVNNAFDSVAREIIQFDNLFKFGRRVQISMGYGSTLELLMIGIITSAKVTFPSSSPSQIEIGGFDLSYRMMKEKKPRSWEKMTDGKIARELMKEYGLREADPPSIDENSIEYPQTVKQEKESDFEFLKRLADRNYYEFFVFKESLYFRSPKRLDEPTVTLEWNASLVSFSPELNIAEVFERAEVKGWDSKQQKEFVGKARLVSEEVSEIQLMQLLNTVSDRNIVTKQTITEQTKYPVSSQDQADSLAKAILSKRNEGLLKGSGESIGIPGIIAGKNIALTELGRQFSRIYYIEKATHSIDNSGYRTTFNVKHLQDFAIVQG